jgi:hypothetical protein
MITKELTVLENLELLVGRINKEQTLTLIQDYLNDNAMLMKSIENNNLCLKILNAKLATFVK